MEKPSSEALVRLVILIKSVEKNKQQAYLLSYAWIPAYVIGYPEL